MEPQSIKKNISLSTAYQVLLLITPLITTPYISRILGPEGNGIYSYTNSYQVYFSMFAGLGTLAYGQREIARNRDNEKVRSKLFWEIELLTVFTTGICILLWFVFCSYQKEYQVIYFILTLNLLNTMFDISWFFAGLEQFQYTIIKNMFFKILGVILQFTLIKDADDTVIYVFILCVTSLLGTMSMWIALPKFLIKVTPRELSIKKHFKETLIYFIPSIATTIYTVLDKTLIGLITGDAKQNGYYEQANKIISMMKALTFAALNNVLGSRISYLFAEKKYEEIKRRIYQSISYILFAGIGMSAGLFVAANRFVPWFFGEEFNGVIGLLKVFCPIVVIIGISNCLGAQYYTPVGLRKKSAKYIIAGAVINLCFNLFLIPHYAGLGAAIASVLAESVITFLYLKNCNGYLKFKDIFDLGWKKVIAVIPMMLIMFWIGRLPFTDIVVLLLELIIGGSVYILVLFIMRDEFISSILNKCSKGG